MIDDIGRPTAPGAPWMLIEESDTILIPSAVVATLACVRARCVKALGALSIASDLAVAKRTTGNGVATRTDTSTAHWH